MDFLVHVHPINDVGNQSVYILLLKLQQFQGTEWLIFKNLLLTEKLNWKFSVFFHKLNFVFLYLS